MVDLRKAARGRPCQVRLPGCDGGGETTVLAHARLIGISGMGRKSPDLLGAHCCFRCHSYADTHHDDATQRAFLEGVLRTQAALLKEGLIRYDHQLRAARMPPKRRFRMNRYTKLAPDGTDLPADATGHQAVRVEHPLLAQPMIWTAHRSPKDMTWKQAKSWAEKLNTCGWQWRLPTVEEAFLLCDRSRTEYPLVDPTYFPDCDGEWIWTATEDLVPPAGCAWLVYLDSGSSNRDRQDGPSHVRAVRARVAAHFDEVKP